MKATAAVAKHKEIKAKAAATNIASKQNIVSDLWTPSPAANVSVCAKTISTGNLPIFPTRGVNCGPGQKSTWAAEAGISLPKDHFVLKTQLVFLLRSCVLCVQVPVQGVQESLHEFSGALFDGPLSF